MIEFGLFLILVMIIALGTRSQDMAELRYDGRVAIVTGEPLSIDRRLLLKSFPAAKALIESHSERPTVCFVD